MPEHDRLDPRYRPEFQRGYDPAVHGAVESPPTEAEPEHSDAPTHAPEAARSDPAATPAKPPTNHTEDTPGGVNRDVVGDAATTGVAPPDAPFAAPPPLWRNPYLIGLVVLGIALIAFGIDRYTWAVGQVATSYARGTSTSAQPDLVTPQVMWALGPLLAVAGVLTLLGVGFFVAWRWIPRKRRPPNHTAR